MKGRGRRLRRPGPMPPAPRPLAVAALRVTVPRPCALRLPEVAALVQVGPQPLAPLARPFASALHVAALRQWPAPALRASGPWTTWTSAAG